MLAFFMMPVHGASIKGGSITYTCLGNNQYKITARISRECSGTAISSYQMNVFNGLGTVAMSATRVSIKDVSLTCSSASQPCSPNQVSGAGVEEHIYEATVDFNATAYKTFMQNRVNNCEVFFSFESFGRDSFTNTMSRGKFFVRAMLNLCIVGSNGCNTAPAYNGRSAVTTCCNQPFLYFSSMLDHVDNDSVAIDTVMPQTGINTFESYDPGYSVAYPVTPYCPPNVGLKTCRGLPSAKPPRGISFEPLTGEYVYTPTRSDENSSIVFRALEFRQVSGKKELVGFSENELGVSVIQCNTNNPPAFTGNNKFTN